MEANRIIINERDTITLSSIPFQLTLDFELELKRTTPRNLNEGLIEIEPITEDKNQKTVLSLLNKTNKILYIAEIQDEEQFNRLTEILSDEANLKIEYQNPFDKSNPELTLNSNIDSLSFLFKRQLNKDSVSKAIEIDQSVNYLRSLVLTKVEDLERRSTSGLVDLHREIDLIKDSLNQLIVKLGHDTQNALDDLKKVKDKEIEELSKKEVPKASKIEKSEFDLLYDHIKGALYFCKGKSNGCSDGDVYGDNPYSQDSHMCTSARHSGVIDQSGGFFEVKNIGNIPSFNSSSKNGITTMTWDQWSAVTIHFSSFNTHKPLPGCGVFKPPTK